MSQRLSGYTRQPDDRYDTPAWVVESLLPHVPPPPLSVWEPAAGGGKVARVLSAAGFLVRATDIRDSGDFLMMHDDAEAVITNPPYGKAAEFIAHALARTRRAGGLVAMLLRTDFDHARSRTHLFGGCKQFSKKLVLTRRIVWFERPGAAPSYNHAWFIWSWRHSGPPIIAYQRQPDDELPKQQLWGAA